MLKPNPGDIPEVRDAQVRNAQVRNADEPILAGPPADLASGPFVATAAEIESARAFVQLAQEQLERDLADIENAAAALRRAEPGLESWTEPVAPATPRARPIWVIIGVLWVSTAILTVGAAVAIAALAG